MEDIRIEIGKKYKDLRSGKYRKIVAVVFSKSWSGGIGIESTGGDGWSFQEFKNHFEVKKS